MPSDVLAARQPEDRAGAEGLPHDTISVNTSSPPGAPRKRRRPANPVPLEQRLLIEVTDGARLMSVSYRTAKRVAAEHPELTALVNRRRLFIRARLEQWIAAGGDARPARR
jgi:hypothetical protein